MAEGHTEGHTWTMRTMMTMMMMMMVMTTTPMMMMIPLSLGGPPQ